MRTNSNKKVHKIKRDPFKTLMRIAGILAAVVVVGIGVFYLCSMAVNSDYKQTRNRIEAENAEAEVEFNARMNELRNANSLPKPGGTPSQKAAASYPEVFQIISGTPDFLSADYRPGSPALPPGILLPQPVQAAPCVCNFPPRWL